MAEWGSLIAFQTTHHSFFSPSNMIPRNAHKRSLSSEHRSLSPDRTVIKAKSTTNLSDIASSNGTKRPGFDESSFSTLQDPRLMVGSEVSHSTSSSHHPDLSNEVAALSVKLIQAINNQTDLDDSLVATRQELELAQGKAQALEFQNEKYRRDIDNKVYIKKFDSDREISQLRDALAEETTLRLAAEKGRKNIEQEVETLTAALFEEANKMVAAAKIEREAVEKKNEQLRSQVKDTELLLASHQDQLAELKSVMQAMNIHKDDLESRATTTPSSPDDLSQAQGSSTQATELEPAPILIDNPEEFTPGPSSSFPQLLRMVCRTDLQAYEDFRDLLVLSRSSKPPSRAASGSYGGLNVMGLASFASGGSPSSTSSPTKGFTHSPNGSTSSTTGSNFSLKETRFYKRVLMEDIEPTLRLDLAPGISWLTRRTVLSSICEGSLVVEPMPPAAKKFEFPCSVCGERRPGTPNERTHRFRTSDSETAQRYSLCVLCLERVRSCCEFTGYLRLILDGHLRAGDTEEEKEIWDETIRLRERMFWSRVGGGIVPLCNRPSELEAEPVTTESNNGTDEDDDDRYLPVDVTYLEPRTEKVSVADQLAPETPITESATEHINHPDLPRPQSSIYDRDDVASFSGSERKRFSIDSVASVYEEASADVDPTSTAPVPTEPSIALSGDTDTNITQSSAPAPVLNEPSIVQSREIETDIDTDIAKPNGLSNS
ncbi:GDPGTP exchange factor Sec2p [Penicillium expansum]|uniref:GDPGTP exchange factor Sec2p n=1 Tax=Penicillium expansum TaxID=27334 RepID=A0A0A2JRS0_PENEN|nr:GDPGTP exchange factor Sec2p [Penicillium expansum]KGO37292.1 GDPGTP exchange factor Sec2p [Penicillium expansum]KGO57541.1 GDPGTP exchange factor Sec2p [Penicillium expansum]KGO62022.1 GDPGTP exchange factor Sec2p [Penicillium expansum]